MERFNLKKLNDVEVKEQYQVKISNRFSALENVDDDDDDDDDDVNNSTDWGSIIENMKASAGQSVHYELNRKKKHDLIKRVQNY